MSKKVILKTTIVVILVALLVPSVLIASACDPKEFEVEVLENEVEVKGGAASNSTRVAESNRTVNAGKTFSKVYQIDFSTPQVYDLKYTITSAKDTSKVTVALKIYKSYNSKTKKLSNELTPTYTKGTSKLFNIHPTSANDKKYRYVHVYIKNKNMSKAKVNIQINVKQDAMSKQKLSTQTVTQTAIVNGNKQTKSYKFVKSTAWLCVYNKIGYICRQNYVNKYNTCKTYMRDVPAYLATTDSIFYLNRLDTQLLYGMLLEVTCDRNASFNVLNSQYGGLTGAACRAIKAVFTKSNDRETKVNELINQVNKNKKYIVAKAFGLTINELNDQLTWWMPSGGGLLQNVLDKMLPKSLVSNFLQTVVGELVDKKLPGAIPSISIDVDAFDLVLDKIVAMFNSTIEKNKQIALTNFRSSMSNLTYIPGQPNYQIPLLTPYLFPHGIKIKSGSNYFKNVVYCGDTMVVEAWDDSVNSNNIYGEAGEAGKFVYLSEAGGLKGVMDVLGNYHRINLEY